MVVKVTKEKYIEPKKDLNSARPYPVGGRPSYSPTTEELALFTKEFNEFMDNEEPLTARQFFLKRRVDEETVKAWGELYPPLKEACYYNKMIVGDRRETLALQGKLNHAIVLKTMPMYDKSYRKMMEWEANLKAKANEANNSGKTVIVVEKFPDSQLVPEKK